MGVFGTLLGRKSVEQKAAKHSRRAHRYAARQRFDQAIREWHKALSLCPKSAGIFANLGSAYFAKGDSARAVDYYLKAVDLGVRDSMVFSNLGVSLRDVGRQEEALGAHERAIELSPEDPIALLNASAVFIELGQLERAFEVLKKADELEPDRSLVIMNLAVVCQALGDHKSSKEYYQRLSEIPEYLMQGLLGLAGISAQHGDVEQAWAYVKDVLQRNPSQIISVYVASDLKALREESWFEARLKEEGLYSLSELSPKEQLEASVMLCRLGQYGEAIGHAKRLLARDPENKREVCHLLGHAYNALEDFEQALTSFNCSLESQPDDAEGLTNRAYCLIRLGRLDEAEETLKRSHQLMPELAVTVFCEAVLCAARADFPQAFSLLRDAVGLDSALIEAIEAEPALEDLRKAASE